MESVAPVESESDEIVSAVMPIPSDSTNQAEAIKELKEVLPKLESLSEDTRRCFGVISENFHAAHRLLLALEKKGALDSAVLDFRQAVVEVGRHMELIASTVEQIEVVTNDMMKGVHGLVVVGG